MWSTWQRQCLQESLPLARDYDCLRNLWNGFLDSIFCIIDLWRPKKLLWNLQLDHNSLWTCVSLACRCFLSVKAGPSGSQSTAFAAWQNWLDSQVLWQRNFQGNLEKQICYTERRPTVHFWKRGKLWTQLFSCSCFSPYHHNLTDEMLLDCNNIQYCLSV